MNAIIPCQISLLETSLSYAMAKIKYPKFILHRFIYYAKTPNHIKYEIQKITFQKVLVHILHIIYQFDNIIFINLHFLCLDVCAQNENDNLFNSLVKTRNSKFLYLPFNLHLN